MWYEDNASSARLGYSLGTMMVRIRELNAETTIRAIANVLRTGVVQTRYYPKGDGLGYQMIIDWPDLRVILLDGVTGADQVNNYRVGLDVRTKPHVSGGANPGLIASAAETYNRVTQMTNFPVSRTIIAGQSMGGAVAQVLAFMGKDVTGFGRMSCVTFGSPRAGPLNFIRAIAQVDLQRWMNTLDPVPCIPPRPNESPIFYAGLGRNGRITAINYDQAHGGTVLSSTGTIASDDVPPAVLPNVQLNLASWLVSLATLQQSEHSMATYLSRLSLLNDLAVPPSRNSTHTPGRETHEGVSVREMNHFVQQGIDQLIEADAQREYGSVVIPQGQAFVARRVGAVWVSQFRGNIISIGPTRRRSRSFCARANVFLNKLQIQGQVDPDSFLAAMTSYLSDAADPQSAFVPTMNV